MKTIPALVTLSLLGAASAPALADIYKTRTGGLYAGANYTFVDVEGNGLDSDLGTLSGKVGANITPFFGVEARAGFGVEDDSITATTDLSANAFYGGYATLSLANESPATPYAILGFTRYELELDSQVFGETRDDDSDLSYGLGVNLAINEALAGNLEYMRYFDKDDVTIDGIGVGLTVSF